MRQFILVLGFLGLSGCSAEGGGGSTDGGTTPTDDTGQSKCSCAGKACGDDGCGTSCGACSGGFQCNSNRCDLDPLGLWALKVVAGEIATMSPMGGAWDVSGGAPDPKVCVTISGKESCTPEATDTFKPAWNYSLPGTYTASELRKGIDVDIIDVDAAFNDPICPRASVPMTPDKFSVDSFIVGCPASLTTAKVTLRLVPK